MSKTEFIKLEDLYKKYYVRISYGSVIPFKKNSKNELIEKPFFSVINDLQRNRRQHPKKSAMERMYKDLGNMLYGKVVCGISNKRSFDSRYEVMKAMEGGFLTNPMIGT
jgi:hypothetical protein